MLSTANHQFSSVVSHVQLFATPWTAALQAPLSLTNSRSLHKLMSIESVMHPTAIVFLPRSKHLLISWLESPPAVILESPKVKFLTVSIVTLSICHEVMGPDAMILILLFMGLQTVGHD